MPEIKRHPKAATSDGERELVSHRGSVRKQRGDPRALNAELSGRKRSRSAGLRRLRGLAAAGETPATERPEKFLFSAFPLFRFTRVSAVSSVHGEFAIESDVEGESLALRLRLNHTSNAL